MNSAAVKFFFLLGKNAAETVIMLKTADKDNALGKTQVYEWFSRFKSGEMTKDDKPFFTRFLIDYRTNSF